MSASNHGGARPGSGRPRNPEPRRSVSIELTDALRARIDEARGEQSLGAWIRETVERRLRRRRR